MNDLISRADAIEAVRKKLQDWGSYAFEDYRRGLYEAQDIIEALPSAELPKGDLISRADVLKYPIRLDHYDEANGNRQFVYGVESVIEYVEALPSAEAESDDLISRDDVIKTLIRMCAPICDYQINVIEAIHSLPSADRPQGEWIFRTDIPIGGGRTSAGYVCSICGKDYFHGDMLDYCPNCGARMESK